MELRLTLPDDIAIGLKIPGHFSLSDAEADIKYAKGSHPSLNLFPHNFSSS